jgi:putative PIN family toxin of toxin-antitoxin system
MQAGSKPYKVAVDTNVWVSFLIGKRLRRLVQQIFDEKILIVTCREQLAELAETVSKPKLSKYFQPQHVGELFDLIEDFAQVVPISTVLKLCRDAKDNYLLSLAVDANAHYLVSGDKDLQVLKQVQATTIISPADFEMILPFL